MISSIFILQMFLQILVLFYLDKVTVACIWVRVVCICNSLAIKTFK
jgi:hypothetical protein